ADQVADVLSQILGMDRETVYKKATQDSSEVWVKRLITPEQVQQILEADLKGVVLVEDTKRYYPMENMLAQVLGYTTIDGVGQEGLEAKYDKYLAGYPGQQLVEIDTKGNELPFSSGHVIPPTDGFGLVTTIDFTIQSFVEKAMEACIAAHNPKKVTAIVMDPKTGEILAMATKPDFDLNNPPRDNIPQLLELSRNSAVLDIYEPGSTFKVLTTAAALEENLVNTNTRFHCPGYRIVDGQKIKCWRSYRPHGSQNLTEAVCNSCNPAFMDMAMMLGKDKYYDYLDAFGIGKYTI
ncbi:MAG TPA: penicillin-binding transpeptidase domain-containing protein, partial [Clostridia bacterium]|nr:penicillin-binding transpeptidase domain-containing protein [Clostridia bacterium]